MPAETMQVAVSAAGIWTAPDAVRGLDAPALDNPVRLGAWAAAQGPDERRDLWGRLDTQALLGDTVLVDDVKDGWAQVVVPSQPCRKDSRGYPGWVPLQQLAPPTPVTADARRVVVTVPRTAILDAPGGRPVLTDVTFATILPTLATLDGYAEVAVPGGRTGWISQAHLSAYNEGESLPTAQQLLTAGRQFLGLMYLAGGTTADGLDCSGLTYGIYRRFGWLLPRDATDQYAVGEPVDLAELAPGDLMFFRKQETGFVYHVGLCAEVIDGWPSMLQSSQTDWDTIDTPITDIRHGHLFAARRLHA